MVFRFWLAVSSGTQATSTGTAAWLPAMSLQLTKRLGERAGNPPRCGPGWEGRGMNSPPLSAPRALFGNVSVYRDNQEKFS